MKTLMLRNNINMLELLSSTTYKTDYFDCCIYCHKEVENDYFDYNGKFIGMPFRCSCEKAKEELKAKEILLEKLNNLQKDIDVDKINNITKQALLNKVNRAYEENDECILCNILKNN